MEVCYTKNYYTILNGEIFNVLVDKDVGNMPFHKLFIMKLEHNPLLPDCFLIYKNLRNIYKIHHCRPLEVFSK